jgi:phosphocarrier protein HPr
VADLVHAPQSSQRRTLKIRNKLGLHARAAVKFVQLAGQFKSEITVRKDGQDANGKSIMGLLTLVAAFGMEIEVEVQGPDAEQAMAALIALVDRGFDEGVHDQVAGGA